MSIRCHCTCGVNVRMPTSAAGKRARCQACGAVFIVPAKSYDPDEGPIQLEGEQRPPQQPAPCPGPSAPREPRPGSSTKPAQEPAAQASPSRDTREGPPLEQLASEERAAAESAPLGLLDLAPEEPEPGYRRAPRKVTSPLHRGEPLEEPARGDHEWIIAPQQSFWRDLAWSFLFFLEAGNLVTFAALVLLSLLPKVLAATNVLPLAAIGFVFGAFVGAYVWAFLLSITLETAAGEDHLPTVWITSLWDDLFRPLLLFLGTWLWVLLPAIAVGLFGLGRYGWVPRPIVVPLVVVGLFFWPAVVLCVSIGGSFRGLWPHTVVRTALAAPLAYLAVCAAILAAAAVMALPSTSTFQAMLAKLPRRPVLAMEMLDTALGVYAMIVAMRVIGLFYRHYKHRFSWTAE